MCNRAQSEWFTAVQLRMRGRVSTELKCATEHSQNGLRLSNSECVSLSLLDLAELISNPRPLSKLEEENCSCLDEVHMSFGALGFPEMAV